ncbi:MAG: VOC family protein [Acidimicrobiales bacterium]
MSGPGDDDPVVFNHVGHCVTDLARARRFYEEVLGFRYWWEMDVPDEGGADRLLQLEAPLGLKAVYLVNGGFVLELLHYATGATRPVVGRRMNDPGLTHLSVAVTDLASVLEKVEAHGGEILHDTDMGGTAVMLRDPDGQLIELTARRFHDDRPPWPA